MTGIFFLDRIYWIFRIFFFSGMGDRGRTASYPAAPSQTPPKMGRGTLFNYLEGKGDAL